MPGTSSTAEALPGEDRGTFEARAVREEIERFHGRKELKAIDAAWPYLGHPDRFIRFAARVAVEFQAPDRWRERALAESSSPLASLNALLALTQVSAQDPAHRRPGDPAPDPALRDKILTALDRLAWDRLDHARQLDLLRVYQVVFNRFGRPDDATVARLIKRFDPHFPAASRELNAELAQVLIYLEAPDAAAKTVALLGRAPTQEEQLDYGRDLRVLKGGWTPTLRDAFFSWFAKAAHFKGGNSLPGFVANIKRDALANLDEAEKARLKPMMEAKAATTTSAASGPERRFVKKWTLDELVPMVEDGLKGRDFDHGRAMFAAAKCFSCHRFDNEGGGLGPELTGLAGRFNTRDLLESIVVPSKTISDQYEAVIIATTDGKVVTGRIANLNNDGIMVNTDMLDPNRMETVRRGDIEEMKPSPVSMMPEGLLDTMDRDEILDLVAYLLSRGDRESPMFRRGAGLGLKSVAPCADGESEAFFNGKDLEGWEGNPEYWSVHDGCLIGKAPAEGLKSNTFLCGKTPYKDFELTFQFRLKDGKGNSGVQFRSRIVDARTYAVAGPQGTISKPFWGGLYGERDPGRWLRLPKQKVVREIVKPTEFNDYAIKCVDKRVTIKLNGTTTVDDHFPEVPAEGIIAWQLREGFPAMEVTFRNIQFKDLSR